MTFTIRLKSAAVGLACLTATALLGIPSQATAADLAWTATRTSFTQLGGGKTASKGTAVFTGGDKADTSSTCTTEPKDAKGWVVVKCESEYRFTDGSLIVLLINSSHDEKTLDAKADASFTAGKGRFEGISGKAAGTGLMGKMQWSGSYSLPARK
ncbi:MAG: hypothetical protein WBA53_02330 [Burkholderiaceae bacterium]